MADDQSAAPRDYRDTVFLPETAFPMRAGLPKLEPRILADWERQGLYGEVRRARQQAGAPPLSMYASSRPADCCVRSHYTHTHRDIARFTARAAASAQDGVWSGKWKR